MTETKDVGLLGTLIERWRKRVVDCRGVIAESASERYYANGQVWATLRCAEELEEALALPPAPPQGQESTVKAWMADLQLGGANHYAHTEKVREWLTAKLAASPPAQAQTGFCEAHQPPHSVCACCEAVHADDLRKELQKALEEWRTWAEFVSTGGGTPIREESDYFLRLAVTKAHADAINLERSERALPPAPPQQEKFTKNADGDYVCEHGTAADVHCCGCHSGFLFDDSQCSCTDDGWPKTGTTNSVEALQVFGEQESAAALKAKDRDQYQFWAGWLSALSKVAAPPQAQEPTQTCDKCGTVVPRRFVAIELEDGHPIDDPAGFEWCIVCHSQRVIAAFKERAERAEAKVAASPPAQAQEQPRIEVIRRRWRRSDSSTFGVPHSVVFQQALQDIEVLLEALAAAPPAQGWQAQMLDAAEMLWIVLANVSSGDWTQQSPEWQDAAARWRDNYFDLLRQMSTALPAPPRAAQEQP